MEKKSQMSLEYLIIVALVLSIIIPAFFLFTTYARESNHQIAEQRIQKMGSEIIKVATEIFYYGTPSMTVIDINMPDNIDKMWIVNKSEDYSLNFNYTLGTIFFKSDVPLGCDLDDCYRCYPQEGCNNDCYCFKNYSLFKGNKKLQITATKDCNEDGDCAILKVENG